MNEKNIKLGFVSGLSGVYGWMAEDQLRGVTMAVELINQDEGIAQKKIEIVSRDDASDPKRAAQETKMLIEKEKIDFLIGSLSAGTHLFINRETSDAKIIFMSIGQSNEITMAPNLGPYTFHEALTPFMSVHGTGKWVFENLGKKVFLVIADYEWGWSVLKTYEILAKNMRADIVGVAKIPFPSKSPDDFTKHFPEILKKKPEVLIANNYGTDQLKFVENALAHGLQRKMSIVNTISELSIMQRIDPIKAVGLYWGANFYWGLKDVIPESKRFVSMFQKQFGKTPSGYAAYGYSGALELLYAAKKINTYPLDSLLIAKELEGNTYAHYKSKQWWRPCDHQSFQDYYILKLKGAEERESVEDIAEIIGTTPWTLDMERTCEDLGHATHLWGH